MASTSGPSNPRDEYAALVRAVAAHVELERSFGIESWSLPAPPAAAPAAKAPAPRTWPREAAPPRPAAPPPAAPREAAPKLAPPPSATPKEAAAMPEPPARVATPDSADLFGAQRCDIQIPEGLSRQEQLDYLEQAMQPCARCTLRKGAKQIVFGVGHAEAELMFIGEAPGHDEDVQGIPFVGKAGQLLTKIIEAMGMSRDEVYIANLCKCRPPENRAPTPEEMDACRPYLLKQIEIIGPKIICLLGATAVRGLLQSKDSISKIRGQFLLWRGLRVMPTFHPAYLLRNPAEKRAVWEDVQKIRDALRKP
jgi:DNA polymerase